VIAGQKKYLLESIVNENNPTIDNFMKSLVTNRDNFMKLGEQSDFKDEQLADIDTKIQTFEKQLNDLNGIRDQIIAEIETMYTAGFDERLLNSNISIRVGENISDYTELYTKDKDKKTNEPTLQYCFGEMVSDDILNKERGVMEGINAYKPEKVIWNEYRWVNHVHLSIFLKKLEGAILSSGIKRASKDKNRYELDSVIRWVNYDQRICTMLSETDYAWSHCMSAISKMFSVEFYEEKRQMIPNKDLMNMHIDLVIAFDLIISMVNASTALAQFMIFAMSTSAPTTKRTHYQMAEITRQQNEQCVKIIDALFHDLSSKSKVMLLAPVIIRFIQNRKN
jgi:hypothetical protein